MPKATVYDMKGAVVGEMDLRDDVFGITPCRQAIKDMVRHHQAACRQGTQSTKTRAEVRGGGRKPWRQKGTGRARQGSTRSPQWTHGGIALGPKPRSYRFAINKKVRRLAMKSALSAKAGAGEILVIDKLDMDSIKTRNFAAFLKALPISGRTLVVLPESRETVIKSARNLPKVRTAVAGVLNVYELLNTSYVLMDREAVTRIEEVYHEDVV